VRWPPPQRINRAQGFRSNPRSAEYLRWPGRARSHSFEMLRRNSRQSIASTTGASPQPGATPPPNHSVARVVVIRPEQLRFPVNTTMVSHARRPREPRVPTRAILEAVRCQSGSPPYLRVALSKPMRLETATGKKQRGQRHSFILRRITVASNLRSQTAPALQKIKCGGANASSSSNMAGILPCREK